MVLIAGLVVFVAILGIRLVPAYIEYATVTKHLRDIARAPDARNATPRDIQVMFSKRAQIDDVKAVSGADIEVVRDGDTVLLTAVYSTKVKLFGNLSACIDFEASSGQ
jgi:hypothetical protein